MFKMAVAAILVCQIHEISLADSGRMPRRITSPNFVKIGRSIAMLQFFVFSRWRPPPSWTFEIAEFYWLFGWRGLRRISVPNFVKIAESVAKIL